MTHSAAHPLQSSPSVEDEPLGVRPDDGDVPPAGSDVRDRSERRTDDVEPPRDDLEARGSLVSDDEDPATSGPNSSARPSPELSEDGSNTTTDEPVVRDEVDESAMTDREYRDDQPVGDQADQADQADEPVRAPSDGNLAPGAPTDDPMAPTWDAGGVERYRGQWHDLQLRFVDDPYAATSEAAGLVEEAVATMTQRLTAQKTSLDGWQSASRDDTEVLRVAMQRYRVFLDRLLAS